MFIALPCAPALWSTRAAGHFREDDGTCHAISLGASFGFVCGAEGVGTTIYAFEPPLAVREVARFASPRIVLASGNGGVVVRGGCARTSEDMGSSERFCFMPAGGGEREVMPPQWGHATGRGFARSSSLTDARCSCWRRARVHRARCSWVTGPPGTESRSRSRRKRPDFRTWVCSMASRRRAQGFLQGGSRVATSCAEFAFC